MAVAEAMKKLLLLLLWYCYGSWAVPFENDLPFCHSGVFCIRLYPGMKEEKVGFIFSLLSLLSPARIKKNGKV